MDFKQPKALISTSIVKIAALLLFGLLMSCSFNHQEERTITPVYNIVGEHVGDVVDESEQAYIKFLN